MTRHAARAADGAAESLAATTTALDSLVHHPVRLGLLTIASAIDECTFAYAKETLGVTDGNLSRNLTVLEEAGFLTVTKGYEGRRPRTWLSITEAGRAALATHLEALKAMAAWTPPTPPQD